MLKNFLTVMSLVVTVFSAGGSYAQESQILVDVLTLQEGKTYADAQEYFDTVVPIIETHGIKRLRSMEVQNIMQGHAEVVPDIVQVWELQAEDPFKGIFSDPDYLQHVELRDSIFDMPRTQFWLATDRTAD